MYKTNYKVIKEYSINDLEHHVNRYIEMGYEPIGQLVVIKERGRSGDVEHLYCQPILRKPQGG